jgi:hypothetical protein
MKNLKQYYIQNNFETFSIIVTNRFFFVNTIFFSYCQWKCCNNRLCISAYMTIGIGPLQIVYIYEEKKVNKKKKQTKK